MTRKTIIVDLDHVTYDFILDMAFWLSDNGVLASPLGEAYRYEHWEVWEDWGMTEGEFMRWWRLGIEAGHIYAHGRTIPGARHALWQLSDAGWDIHIATQRLNKFGLHDRVVENTVSWLYNNNIPYRQLSFVSDKTNIWANAIVDDVENNMSHFIHEQTFLFPANHNSDHLVGVDEQRKAWENIVTTLST